MRNGFNNFSIPYFNELTANQFDAASVFNGNTPVAFIKYSMDTMNGWMQSPPQTGRPEDFEEVIINGRKVLRRKVTQLDQILGLPQTPQTPPINPTNQSPTLLDLILDPLGKKRSQNPANVPKDLPGYKTVEKCTDQNGNDVPKGTPGSQCANIQVRDAGINAFGQNILGIEGLTNRTIIVFVGILILVAAILSFR